MAETIRRRVVMTLEIGADSWSELADSLRCIAHGMDRGQHRGRVVSGGPSSGYIADANEDESITHDSYFEAIDRWKDTLRVPCPAEEKADG